jgi:hypothetical protein
LILIVEVARFSGVFEVYYDAEPYSTKDRPGILSVLLREYDWASFTMDPSGASIVKISARTVNPSPMWNGSTAATALRRFTMIES